MAFILIVDASETAARRASDALIAAGHACGWAPTAARAVPLVRWRRPELILLDQEATGADGGNLPQALRRAAEDDNLPIILLTTRAPARDAGDRPGNGVQDQLRKPFDPRFLVWRANHALEAHDRAPLPFETNPRPEGCGGPLRTPA